MATCPHCGQYLDERHRCSGVWRLWLRAWTSIVLAGVVGGVAGWAVLALVFGQVEGRSIVLIAVVAAVIWRAILRGSP